MKKVLSVAMASAMVLSMGANAFAISYSTGSNEKADWPEKFQFEGSLFVTDKDGNIVKEATTAINDNETVNFEPGDVIWMPLYADDQVEYTAKITEGTEDKIGVNDIKIVEKDYFTNTGAETVVAKWDATKKTWSKDVSSVWKSGSYAVDKDGTQYARGSVSIEDWTDGATYTFVKPGTAAHFVAPTEVKVDGETRTVSSVKVTVNGRTFTGAPATVETKVNDYLENLKDEKLDTYLPVTFSGTVSVKAEDGKDTTVDKPVVDNTQGVTVAHGHYTGNIDKNWSINLIEKSTGVAELIEKAELYKATKNDYASYIGTTTEIMPNAVYLKITLEDEWKTTTSETLKYYVYVADNKSNKNKTNEVWVSGKYANTDVRPVSFDWTNDASKAGLWKVKEGNGIAVFDFADKAFFSVKMYEGETMYLDLGTAYDKAIAGEMDAEADSFYKFDNTNANFARTGELVIVSDDSSLVPYQIDEDGNFVAVDAEYVENYAVAHTNKKVNGFVFNTKQLGNYVLSTEELGEEEEVTEEPTTEEPAVEEPVVEEPVVEETNKPNPNTGAEDFVGLAVSLAVVSVAAAGALALKK